MRPEFDKVSHPGLLACRPAAVHEVPRGDGGAGGRGARARAAVVLRRARRRQGELRQGGRAGASAAHLVFTGI